ncbi:hypothetical protein [Algoriphagus sp.]|uniref:hypothetical protein n=1 Tax=Algoriphagus sp. TaxID=1872435 RepID=UPI003F6F3D5D
MFTTADSPYPVHDRYFFGFDTVFLWLATDAKSKKSRRKVEEKPTIKTGRPLFSPTRKEGDIGQEIDHVTIP